MPTPVYKSENKTVAEVHKQENKQLGKFAIDDIILAVVALMLLTNECDDKLLLVVLALVFLA